MLDYQSLIGLGKVKECDESKRAERRPMRVSQSAIENMGNAKGHVCCMLLGISTLCLHGQIYQ